MAAAAALVTAAAVWASIGYTAYWGHTAQFEGWLPATMPPPEG